MADYFSIPYTSDLDPRDRSSSEKTSFSYKASTNIHPATALELALKSVFVSEPTDNHFSDIPKPICNKAFNISSAISSSCTLDNYPIQKRGSASKPETKMPEYLDSEDDFDMDFGSSYKSSLKSSFSSRGFAKRVSCSNPRRVSFSIDSSRVLYIPSNNILKQVEKARGVASISKPSSSCSARVSDPGFPSEVLNPSCSLTSIFLSNGNLHTLSTCPLSDLEE
ncbi:hypothetical protein BB561_001429 [Smittium simulii]|uniref:Uncharacterized protein n=1 Tax=Smittium simulii TaxID=133385 RepID=A0A2T9YUK8_9FUNG|nr:hypothetical protein BB561_001429 [Smittium simulii]